MKRTAYIETSVISYLTGRPSRDEVTRARQEATREWWRTAKDRFNLAASVFVFDEASRGDPDAARARLAALQGLKLLDATERSERLARELIAARVVPSNAEMDAAHIAVAAANSVDYLVTWNFGHIANVAMQSRIERVCREASFKPPVICVPSELMEINHGED